MDREYIFAAAERAGFKCIDSCCSVPFKTCSNDIWKGDLVAFVKELEKGKQQKCELKELDSVVINRCDPPAVITGCLTRTQLRAVHVEANLMGDEGILVISGYVSFDRPESTKTIYARFGGMYARPLVLENQKRSQGSFEFEFRNLDDPTRQMSFGSTSFFTKPEFFNGLGLKVDTRFSQMAEIIVEMTDRSETLCLDGYKFAVHRP